MPVGTAGEQGPRVLARRISRYSPFAPCCGSTHASSGLELFTCLPWGSQKVPFPVQSQILLVSEETAFRQRRRSLPCSQTTTSSSWGTPGTVYNSRLSRRCHVRVSSQTRVRGKRVVRRDDTQHNRLRGWVFSGRLIHAIRVQPGELRGGKRWVSFQLRRGGRVWRTWSAAETCH